jgi:flagellar protein FlbD
MLDAPRATGGRRGRLAPDGRMILLTRLNERPFILNAELIKTVEETPDTLVSLVNGDQVLVKESMGEVVRKAIQYNRAIRTFRPADGQTPAEQMRGRSSSVKDQ